MNPAAFGLFAWQAGLVFSLRCARLAAEPELAAQRLTEMMVEKQLAFAEGCVAASLAVIRGAAPVTVAEAALRPVRLRVRANAKRVARGGV